MDSGAGTGGVPEAAEVNQIFAECEWEKESVFRANQKETRDE